MTKQQLSFENENMGLTVNKAAGCNITFIIKTKPLATKAAQEAALKAVAKEVNIPGFRKGRAPDEVVLEKFKPQVDKEFRDTLVKNSFYEAIQLSSTRPSNASAQVQLRKLEPAEDGSFNIEIEFEAFPEVPTVDLKTLPNVDEKPAAVQQSDVERRIEELRMHHAEWEEITDRPAEKNDFVILDIEIIDDTPQQLHKDSRFHLIEGKMPAWARQLVTGLNIGESAEGFSEPENNENPEEFTPRKCKITLKRIQVAKLPELDTALAIKAGVADVEALKEAIKKSLGVEAERKAHYNMQLAMKRYLINQYSFELPAERLKNLHAECHDIADQEKAKFATDDQRRAYAHKLLAEAEQSVCLSYLLPKVMKDNQLPYPGEQEIRQRATEHLMQRYWAGDTQMNSEVLQHFSKVAENELASERVLDFLINSSKKS